jgi:hypothetical protein
LIVGALQRRSVGFAGADTDRRVDTETKIFAVADLAGFGAAVMASMTLSTMSDGTATSTLSFGRSSPRIQCRGRFQCAPLTPVTLDLGDGHAVHPIAVSASRTSSSLNGLMTAMTIFIGSIPVGPSRADARCGR